MSAREAMSAAILCGGHSRRMGRDKAGLAWGDGTLLDAMLCALSGLDEVYLSVDRDRFPRCTCRAVEDRYPGSGPLGGICSALQACKTPLLFVSGCDMPLVTGAVAHALRERIPPHAEAAVPQDASGRVHPLCAIYRQTAVSSMVQQLQTGDFRLVNALRRMNTVYVPAETLPGGETVLANLNTPNEYAALLKKVRGDYSNP